MPSIDYAKARELLDTLFIEAEAALFRKSPLKVESHFADACESVFGSGTQAYREVLLGCTVARTQDPSIDVRRPYVEQGPNAFSGRSLDEKVVNPFLQRNRIPCSRGPYLSVFRRSIKFDSSTRSGLRDKVAYDSLLEALVYLQDRKVDELLGPLGFQLYKFAELRETADIPLARVQRISLDQYDKLIGMLLTTPSGGLFPVLLVVATFRAIKAFFKAQWEITWQGINVSDAASGAGGDVTISNPEGILLAVEVTERTVDKSRVVTTFNSKIAVNNIGDYLFVVGPSGYSAEAKAQAQRYFAQGHEVNFVDIEDWIIVSLATMGTEGRAIFNAELMGILDGQGLRRALRVSWNNHISDLLAT
ncbi:MAG: restriction endonuclease, SacI family [Dehalococcoidia bacterium]|nr:restriction endonuclease, SacI family [Dehalococcoidia bacterium]